jgi:hypothetical protein
MLVGLLPCSGQVQPFLWSEEVIIELASSRILELPARLWKGCWQHTPSSQHAGTALSGLLGTESVYCRAMAMRITSSGETRWSRLSASSAMASWTPLTRPENSFPRDP